MTGATMSLFQGAHQALNQPNLFKSEFKSEIKSKLGFSIDSIVGHTTSKSPASTPPSPPPASPPRVSWSPLQSVKRPHSPPSPHFSSRSPRPRSRSPLRQPSVSPPRQESPSSLHTTSIHRPTPTSPPTLAQTYLDQLASLKAFYEAKGGPGGLGHPGGPPPQHQPHPLLPPGLSLPHGLSLPPRPPASLGGPFGLPPGMPSPLHPHGMPPREYPLHPWFINRHRFPLGKNHLTSGFKPVS